ncbi:MAG: hypothetical protein UX61_C0031G0004 [Parcubacteria group bacterium GW2011_GWA2_46_7]|nr:MAG: hypothetical protein UX61_C0031G0004 [Parcubacteria group bacterium GW2011_GWA2_46_7]
MSLLPNGYLNAVVSVEKKVETQAGEPEKFRSIASGFLVGFPTGQQNDKGDKFFRIFLISNRHVFKDQKEVWLKFNHASGSKRYLLPLTDEKNNQLWETHSDKDVDVGVIPIAVNKLQEDGVEFAWIAEDLFAYLDKIKELGITQGDEMFVLGFPMGIAGEEKKYVIVKGGIISRLDDEIIKSTKTFLVDSSVFPGNSGGPVILKPAIVSIDGTSPVNRAYLLGLVKGYIPYEEIAYSLQSDPPQPRIKFVNYRQFLRMDS